MQADVISVDNNAISVNNNSPSQALSPEPEPTGVAEEIVLPEPLATVEREQPAAPELEPARVAGLVPRAFWTQKSGNSETDYEDGWATGIDCLAIADGATESSFARLWAQALTAGFVAGPNAIFPLHTERMEQCRARIQEWTQPLQAEWHSRVPWNNLPWFAEDKARAGAFATLLAFKVNDERGVMNDEYNITSNSSLITPHSSFQMFAIGDSCLFQIRDGQLKLAFPLTHSSQFDSTPLLLSSNPANNKRVWNEIAVEEGVLQAGDILLFATDALARWFLAEVEAGSYPWHELCGMSGQSEFIAFVTRLRQARAMRNDDVTLVIVDASHMPQATGGTFAFASVAASGENAIGNTSELSEPAPDPAGQNGQISAEITDVSREEEPV